MTECQEVAISIDLNPRTLDEALDWARRYCLVGESETVVSNVAWAMFVTSDQRAHAAGPLR